MGCGSVFHHDELGGTAGLLVSAGAAAAVSGSIMLGKSLSPFPKPPAHARLIRRGPYAVVRHPITPA
jgi:protein-S-isoprenylcysteine O-methyltransferase Ste14